MNFKTSISFIAVAIAAMAPAVAAQSDAVKAWSKDDGAWISITGDAKEINVDGFVLDYGGGDIDVEIDDWDITNEAEFVTEGMRATVYGRIDDSFLENRSIEASSVYLPDQQRFVYASAADEEGDDSLSLYYPFNPSPDAVTVSGDVKRIDGREIVLDTGAIDMKIDTLSMAHNPLDAEGYQKIEPGDRISVVGEFDGTFFDDAVIDAESIVTVEES